VRALSTIFERTVLAIRYRGENFALGGLISLQLVDEDHARDVCRIEPGLKGIAEGLGSVLKCVRSRDVGGGAHQIGEKLDDQLLVPSRTR
jgi:hypothetical protein